MAIPLLNYPLVTQNPRVGGYEIAGDDQPRIFSTENLLSPGDIGTLIEAAYRQIFFHAFASDREPFLESQLRFGQITVRDFIQGLLLSETFKSSFYEKNSNYRFVEQCVQRILGRDIHGEQEKRAWAIIVATKGIEGFVDELLGSDEYLDNFGYNTVPYQRRRVLPGRSQGELPFNIKSPRYDGYYRSILGFPQIIWQTQITSYKPQDKKPKAGDPALYADMARALSIPKNPLPRVSAQNINIEASVPYRKSELATTQA
ncbi:MAG: phycobilisome rod-core linker polypeptide CpcG [Symploca sp. SIO3C6]|uniref:Phycobilisome rod-core linker polypeptide CpcG n=1 Tax=Symploca sp. SIO1C4 TaxID=2607765 RepID=A0A6B3NMY9_9CYAN|nr:phycobilisome rod-core linker polypeptide CpcG [Symploca sp. SIO3C6]NER31594.1 phycobilisome rod-core linker polypeptide CpcG [Symploca sp. SIO1C4]